MRRGWRRKVGQDIETVKTGSKEGISGLGDEVNVATLLRSHAKTEALGVGTESQHALGPQ